MTSRVLWNSQRCTRSTAFVRNFNAIQRIVSRSTARGLPFSAKRRTDRAKSTGNTFMSSASSAGDISRTTEAMDDEAKNGLPTSTKFPRICILGGGFGGLYTAIKLEGLMWPNGIKPQVTLIDQNDRFVFKPLLYEILEGTADEMEVAPFFKDLLAPFQTQFLQARVESIQVSNNPNEGGSVLLSDGSSVAYDWLVVAIGAKTNFRGLPGVREFALPFCSFSDVQKIINVLTEICQNESRASNVVVVGAGYAGVELATALCTKIKTLCQRNKKSVSIQLITDTECVLPMAPASQRGAAEQKLKKDDIEIKTGFFVKAITAKKEEQGLLCRPTVIALTPASGQGEMENVEADLVLWTAGNAPAIEQTFPFEKTRFGCLKTEPSLRVVSQKRVFALGDDAVIENSKSSEMAIALPATAQVAFQQADYVSWNLWASINNKPLLSFRYQHLGDMMSLGAENAAIALPLSLPKSFTNTIRNSPLSSFVGFFGVDLGDESSAENQRPTLEGNVAAFLRRAAYWYRQPTSEQRAKIARSYLDKLFKTVSTKRGKS